MHLWVVEPEPRRELVSEYSLGGNPGSHKRRGVPRNTPGSRKRRGAPVLASDGQALLYTKDTTVVVGEFYALQSTSVLDPPPWATVVGPTYRLTATPHAPQLAGNASLSIGYLTPEVVPGQEPWIRVYYQDGHGWRPLPTRLDTDLNLAAAPTQGTGVYALLASVSLPLAGPGWHNLPYPVEETRPVTTALASLDEAYTSVWHYTDDPPRPLWQRWQSFHPGAPTWVNDLQQMCFGQSYWLYVTRASTWYLAGNPRGAAGASLQQAQVTHTVPADRSVLAHIPAVYYGTLSAAAGGTLQAGQPIEARMHGQVCGAARRRSGMGTRSIGWSW